MTTLPGWADDASAILTAKFPAWDFGFKYHKHDQIEGSCPVQQTHECWETKGGEDRFIVFANGNYFCRKCHAKGRWRVEPAEEREERHAQEKATREQMRQKIMACKDWIAYHDTVGLGVHLWEKHGIGAADIDKWGLGYCEQAPCVNYPTASLTIPIFYDQKLVDIRHRLVTPQGLHDKYRSHFPGLPPAYFNLDGVRNANRVFLVEGEKKAVVCNHYGLATAAFPGIEFVHFLSDIIPRCLTKSQELIFLPDPDAGQKLAPTVGKLRELGYRVRVLDLIEKPDDFILTYGVDALTSAIPYTRWF